MIWLSVQPYFWPGYTNLDKFIDFPHFITKIHFHDWFLWFCIIGPRYLLSYNWLKQFNRMKSTVVSSVPEWGSCREASAAESEGRKSLLWTDSSGGPESCSVRSPPSIWERLLRVTHFSTSTDGARYHQKRQIMWPQTQLQQCLSTQMSPKQDSTEGKGFRRRMYSVI